MNMLFLLIVLVIVVVAVLAFVKVKSQGGVDDEVWPFYPKKPLSQPEQVLYFRLVQALPDHIVLAQVQLSRLLGVKKGNNYQAWFNRINRMSADFVVCNKDSSIVAVIELDDATHQKEDRQAADAKKDKALSSAGIRIIRWQAKAIPDVGVIQATFMPNIAVKRDAPQAARPLNVRPLQVTTQQFGSRHHSNQKMHSKRISKTDLYKSLLARMDKASTAGYYMESCWIQYAIVEDRFNSVIRHAYPQQGAELLKTLRGLDRKLEHIAEKIHPRDSDCLKTVHKELLERIKRWKDKRNALMHEITETPDYETINEKLARLAPEGTALINELGSRVRKYKSLVKRREAQSLKPSETNKIEQ